MRSCSAKQTAHSSVSGEQHLQAISLHKAGRRESTRRLPSGVYVHMAHAELDLQQCLAVARAAALAAGAVIKQNFGSGRQKVEQKSSDVDLVTETDKQCEDVIKSMLQQQYPNHHFIGEETAAAVGGQGKLTDEPTWMVRGRLVE